MNNLTHYQNACQRALEWENPVERPMMIKIAWETIGSFYIEGRITAEQRDQLYRLLNNHDDNA